MTRRYIVSCGCGRATASVHASNSDEARRIAIRRLGKYNPDDCTTTVIGDDNAIRQDRGRDDDQD